MSHHRRRLANHGAPSVAEKDNSSSTAAKTGAAAMNGSQMHSNNKIFDDFEIPFETKKDRGPSIIGLIDS
jgi:hypothetical protein